VIRFGQNQNLASLKHSISYGYGYKIYSFIRVRIIVLTFRKLPKHVIKLLQCAVMWTVTAWHIIKSLN